MKKQRGFAGMAIFIIIIVLIGILGVIGYIGNIVALVQCDFDVPLKAEILRTVGIFIPPVGVVMGYCEISDEKPK